MIVICEKCFATMQVNYEITVEPNRITYCSLCGSNNTKVRQDMSEESWFVISDSLGLPVVAVKELFKLWDMEENKNFCNWVKDKIKIAQTI